MYYHTSLYVYNQYFRSKQFAFYISKLHFMHLKIMLEVCSVLISCDLTLSTDVINFITYLIAKIRYTEQAV